MDLKFSERLKELRIESKLTQKQLSDKLDGKIKQSSIARWEQGERVPGLDSAKLLAEYFGVSIDYLAGLED
ncbi:MAG: helix-turn-helix transcriptional regulator [Clostridiales bacterium]|nr:helix-turn-helix transcriptional regulator [Clostridiales bacterium]